MTQTPSHASIGIALIGPGIVGTGVARILADQRELIADRTGLSFSLKHVIARDALRPRDAAAKVTGSDWRAAVADPAVGIVVELIGGTTTAYDIARATLSAGKPLVTANKSLLAAKGPELFALAKQHNTCIAFEASCGGGIPIINALSHGLLANRVDAMVGIVNGTCNFILTRMTRGKATYAAALAEAQAAGFAEADPTLDVSGRDAAQKLAVLAGLAFNARVGESDIHIEGIDTLEADDIHYAGELGYVIKLLAIAQRHGTQLSLRVQPSLVHKSDVLAEVGGSFNAISVWGHALGHALFYGRGAGQMPTASAVVADLIGVGLGVTTLAFKQLRIFPDTTAAASVQPIEQLQSRYYLRLTAKDQPGVLAQVAAVLGTHAISCSSVLQHEHQTGGHVPVVITTHRAREGAVRAAIKQINALSSISRPTVCLRIIDQPAEFAG